MRGIADLDLLRSRHRRARIDQVDGIEHARAILALVAARAVIAAMRTGADDVAVRQEAAVGDGIDLLRRAHVEIAALPELRARNAGSARGSAGSTSGRNNPRTARSARQTSFWTACCSAQNVATSCPASSAASSVGRAVFVGGADEQRLVPARALEAREHVGGKHRADEIAQMLDAVDVGQGRGDQCPGHNVVIGEDRKRSEIIFPARIRPPLPADLPWAAAPGPGARRSTRGAIMANEKTHGPFWRMQSARQPPDGSAHHHAADRRLVRLRLLPERTVGGGTAAGARPHRLIDQDFPRQHLGSRTRPCAG